MTSYPAKKKYTSEELTDARQDGFGAKKPKQPKKATPTSVKSYLTRWNSWVDQVKSRAKATKARRTARAKGTPTDKQKAESAMRG